MKSILVSEYGGSDVLEVKDFPVPEPSVGQVRIKAAFTSVNFADIKMRRGGAAQLPFTPGLDASGVVDAVGDNVDEFEVGQRVAAYVAAGSYAEYVLAEAELCYPLPDAVSFEQGAGIGILITAYNVLMNAGRFRTGESVLVHAGAGGVGSTLVQLARALGAERIFATVGSDKKADIASRMGADEVINYRESSFDEVINEKTDGKGVDLILDSVAGPNAERGMNCLADFGRLVIYGHTGEGGAASISSKLLHKSNRAVIGYSSGDYRKSRPEVLQKVARKGLELLSSRNVNILLGECFKLEDAAAAHEWVESRRSVGKVLLEP